MIQSNAYEDTLKRATSIYGKELPSGLRSALIRAADLYHLDRVFNHRPSIVAVIVAWELTQKQLTHYRNEAEARQNEPG